MALPLQHTGRHWAIPAGRHVELPGRGTTFVREAAGPPGAPTVILLHGLGAIAAPNWDAAFEPLGRHFGVVATVPRGPEGVPRSKELFRLADWADDAGAVADAV